MISLMRLARSGGALGAADDGVGEASSANATVTQRKVATQGIMSQASVVRMACFMVRPSYHYPLDVTMTMNIRSTKIGSFIRFSTSGPEPIACVPGP